VQEVRVYYDPITGDIIHIHELVGIDEGVGTPGFLREGTRITEEMTAFEESLRERHQSNLEYLVVDETSLQDLASDDHFRVDVVEQRLIRDDR
jgi:hypothetical protein